MKGIKKLRGNRVYLEIPPIRESVIEMSEEAKAEMAKEEMKKFYKLKVLAVGDTVSDIVEGDLILVDPGKLQTSYRIPISPTKDVLMVSSHDIAHVWD